MEHEALLSSPNTHPPAPVTIAALLPQHPHHLQAPLAPLPWLLTSSPRLPSPSCSSQQVTLPEAGLTCSVSFGCLRPGTPAAPTALTSQIHADSDLLEGHLLISL